PSLRTLLEPFELGAERKYRTSFTRLLLVGVDEFVHIDDARFGRKQRAFTDDVGFESARFRGVDEAHISGVVVSSPLDDGIEARDLSLGSSDDELARLLMRDRESSAALVEKAPTFGAGECFERAGRMVERGVDHPAVPTRRFHPGAGMPFEDGDGPTLERHEVSRSDAQNPRTNDDTV